MRAKGIRMLGGRLVVDSLGPNHSSSQETYMPDEFPSTPDEATAVRVRSLQEVAPDLFDRVWKIIQECGQYERHFNTLQGVYRGLASTWLLAMFAGIGFVVKERVEPTYMLICLAGIAATAGIFVLWSLDINVYHRLLLAVFYDGREFERACLWLPPVRNRMKDRGNEHAVRRSVCWFYTALMLVAGAVAVGGASLALRYAAWRSWKAAALAAAIVALAGFRWYKCETIKIPCGTAYPTPKAARGGTAGA